MKIIREEFELVGLLAASPATRHVLGDGVVREILDKDGGVIAEIEEGSAAAALLDRAFDAEQAGDFAAWVNLPVRYGPCCGEWVHRSHPAAPTTLVGDQR